MRAFVALVFAGALGLTTGGCSSHSASTSVYPMPGGKGIADSGRREERPSSQRGKDKKPPNVERGIASWYGEKYHGRTTANGERFDMNAMTAAHKTLPFGTKVRVVNLVNGKSVVVRINDRGPFKPGRIIDVSKGAAKKLDMVAAGLVEAEVIILAEP